MFAYALSDLKRTMAMLPVAYYLARSDLKARYRRSMLGPLWLVLGTAVGVTGLGILWSVLLHENRATFIPSLTVGLVVWQLISGTVIESTRTFSNNYLLIRNLAIPFGFYPLQLIMRQVVNFAHNALVILAVLLIYPPHWSAVQWLCLPGFLLVLGNLYWIALMLGMMGARFRDLENLIAAFMPLLFFLTPVIYRPEQLGFKSLFAWLNPFSYLISVIRDPLQGHVPAPFVWEGAIILLVFGWLSSLYLLQTRHGRVAFWV